VVKDAGYLGGELGEDPVTVPVTGDRVCTSKMLRV
jgi:hypothetical protein